MMHDTFLLNNISKSLSEICISNKISKIRELSLIVNEDSHINKENLAEFLMLNNRNNISKELEIFIQKDNIESKTAIIKSIKGEDFDSNIKSEKELTCRLSEHQCINEVCK